MYYIKIAFTKGLECDAFQEVDDSGIVLRYLDISGIELVLPEITESHVIDPEPRETYL